MKRTLGSIGGAIFLVLFTLGLQGCQQQPADTPENRLEAAREYQQISPLKVTLDDAVQDLAKQFPPEKRDDFIQYMRMNISADAVVQKAVEAMADHFTVQEIRALTDFYGSPEGRSINEKYGEYMADIMPVVQSQLSQTAGAWLAEQGKPKQEPAEPQPEPEGGERR